MDERYLSFSEETNALDYLEHAARFIREAASGDNAWKWVIIALHGAIYGFAICACKGTDYYTVTKKTKRGRRLIPFSDALKACQDPRRMRMTVRSKALVLSVGQKAAINKLQEPLRNRFEHYTPGGWHIEIHGMPIIAIHCLGVLRFLALETGNYTMLTGDQYARVETLISESIVFLRAMPLHEEYLRASGSTSES